MIAPRTRGRIYLQSFMDALITFSWFWAYLFLFILLHPGKETHGTESLGRYFIYSFIALGAVWMQGARTIYSHQEWWRPTLTASHHLSLNQVVHVLVGISIFLVATRENSISRMFLFSWLPLLYLSLLLANRFLPAKISEMIYDGGHERTVFLGRMESAAPLEAWRNYQQSIGTKFLDYTPDFSIADLAHLERLIRERNVTQLILTEIPEVKYNLQYVIEICDRLGVRFLVSSNSKYLFRHSVTIEEEGGLQFIGLRDESLEIPHNRIIKRLFDLGIALPIVLILLPLAVVVVWIAQRFGPPGPLFIKQERAGLTGRLLWIYKFHTKHLHSTVGGWLRISGLDNLPQFLNVLRGDMSVVGPRPHLLQDSEQFARILRNQYIRTKVKPGITGLAQVHGFRGGRKSEEDMIRRVELDVTYFDSWSLGLDLAIIARTVWQLIRPAKPVSAPEESAP